MSIGSTDTPQEWLQQHRHRWQAELTQEGFRALTRMIAHLDGEHWPEGHQSLAERAWAMVYAGPVEALVGRRSHAD